MTLLYGIDISVHNGVIKWDTVKESGKVDFAILRAGYGKVVSQKDKQFERNYSEAKRVGIPIGAYWYSYAMTPQEAKQEAKVFMDIIRGKQFEYPVYLDIEEKKQIALGKQAVSNLITAFCEELEANGYFVGVYSSKSYFNTVISDKCKSDYTSWVAAWSSKPNYSGPFDIWQKSDKGSIPGISGNVDLDECYRNFPHIIKNLGKNGFERSEKLNNETTSTNQSSLVSPVEETIIPEKPAETLVKPVEEQSASEKQVKETKALFSVKIICNALNVRTGPRISAKAVGVVRNGEVYAIAEEKNGWGRINNTDCWISILSKYVKKL